MISLCRMGSDLRITVCDTDTDLPGGNPRELAERFFKDFNRLVESSDLLYYATGPDAKEVVWASLFRGIREFVVAESLEAGYLAMTARFDSVVETPEVVEYARGCFAADRRRLVVHG